MSARLFLILATLAGLRMVAGAEATVPVVTLPTILVGVGDRAGWQRAMDDRLDEGIRRAGRAPKLPGPLTGSELGCREPECMARVAEGASAGIVLGAKVVGDRGSPPSYKLVLTRFDHDHPGAVRQETAECSVCTQGDAGERLVEMVAAMLPSLVVQPPPIAAEIAPAAPALVARPERVLSKKLVIAAIATSAAFGVAGLAMLGAGGRGLAIDGQASSAIVPPATQSASVYDTRGAGIGLTVAGSLLVVSAAVELGFEVWLLKRRAK